MLPLTGIFLIAEITGGYELIIPLMIVSSISYILVKYFQQESLDIKRLKEKGVKKTKITTLLFKPEAYKKPYAIDYVGFNIPNDFVVGYGLDYDGLGRNLKEIHVLA